MFPDYSLPDHTGAVRTLSELQGSDPLILRSWLSSTLSMPTGPAARWRATLVLETLVARAIARSDSARLSGLGALSLRAQLRELARTNKRLALYRQASAEEKHFR